MITPKYKVGQRVRVNRPKDISEFPDWMEDDYDKKILPIINASIEIWEYKEYVIYLLELKEHNFWFNEKWLTPTTINYQKIKRLSKCTNIKSDKE